MQRFAPFFLFAFLFAVGFALPTAVPQATGEDGGSLAAASCSSCHSVGRICSKMGKKDAAYWSSTVARMKSNGASIDDAQVELISGWLAAQSEAAAPLCN